jgi:RNA polymerase subunit RPABC4/transcription elongation factor Spt4
VFGIAKAHWATTVTLGLLLTGSVGLLLPGVLALPATGLGGTPTAHAQPMASAPAAVTHGDLVVGPANSPYVIQTFPAGATYYEEGNVTVLAGGTLIVRNTTFDMLQFVGTTGNVANRLSHLYTISVLGVAVFDNSTLTSDVSLLNAYVKVPVSVSGGGMLIVRDGSHFAFPGWVTVSGAGSSLYVNNSFVMGNPLASNLPDSSAVLNDTLYAPTLNVSAGGVAFFGGSAVVNTYKDDVTSSGWPSALLIDPSFEALNVATPGHWSSFGLSPSTSQGLAQAALYPSIAAGIVTFDYSAAVSATSTGSFANSGSTYSLGALLFSSIGSRASAALPAAAVHQINTMGLAAFLQATGGFGTPTAVYVNLTGPTAAVNVTQVSIQLIPTLSYDVIVSGGTLTAVDSLFDLNFNQSVPAANSNKLALSNGAHAFLANLSTTGGPTGGFSNSSAILPDASSNATIYRWMAVPVLVAPGAPIPNALATAYYAFDTSQTNNATAVYYNTLAPAPGLLNWVNRVDTARGVTVYGTSPTNGMAELLLASTIISQASLPDGNFLGEYHVAVNLVGGGTHWQDSGVSPYPTNMSPAHPDVVAPALYPNFHALLGASGLTVAVGTTIMTNDTVAIGQLLNISFTITNTGPAPATSYSASLWFTGPFNASPQQVGTPLSGGSLNSGASVPASLTWLVSESVTGRVGTINALFSVQVAWNNGIAPLGGSTQTPQNVTILPAEITVAYTPIGVSLNETSVYETSGSITFAGAGLADVWVNVSNGGAAVPYSVFQTHSGPFDLEIQELTGMAPGTYTLLITVGYNHRFVHNVAFANAFVVPGPPPPVTGVNILFESFFGFPLWIWILIGAGIVGGVLGGLSLARSSARGRLVECGECGELIPESALSCPKCGAEFETDLVRCSRCGSTIPARSNVCPECSATLLGKEESAARDPDRQGYSDFVERYRIEARKELGENYSESAFWDWWKRQQSYVPFSQWKLQQAQGSRLGMGAPPAMSAAQEEAPPPMRRGGGPPPGAAPPMARAAAAPAPAQRFGAPAPAAPSAAGAPAGGAGTKACPNCGKEVPPDFLVCPFCGAVTR